MGLSQKICFWKKNVNSKPIIRKVFNRYAIYFSFPAADGHPVGDIHTSGVKFSIHKEKDAYCLVCSKDACCQAHSIHDCSNHDVIAKFKDEFDAREALKAIEAALTELLPRKVVKIVGVLLAIWAVSTLGQFAKAISSAPAPQSIAQQPSQMFLPPASAQPGLGLSGDGDSRYRGGLEGILDPNNPVIAGCGKTK